MIQSPQPRTGPTVSVVIAAYNAAPFLHRAVESALSQSLQPLEVLVVDDASIDATVKVVADLTRQDSRVRITQLQENRGPAAARNAGIDAARGEWIAVLDADDAFMTGRLERLIGSGMAASADIIADNFLFCRPEAGHIGHPAIAAEPNQQTIDRYEFVAHARPYTGETDWGLLKPLFRREFLNRNHLRYPVFSRHGEDFLLIVQALLAGGRYVLSRTPGYLYTSRGSGMSRTEIDYKAQIRHSMKLLNDLRVRPDRALVDLILLRCAALERLHNERRANQLIDLADSKEIARCVLTEPKLATEIFRSGIKRVRRLLRRR